MKNGEEVVSVGGAVDQSNKNVGTSASNSIILDLVKVIFHLFVMQSWKTFNIKAICREIGFGFSFCVET